MRIERSVLWRNDWIPYHPYGEPDYVRKSWYPNIDWFNFDVHFFTRTGLFRLGGYFMLFGIGFQAYMIVSYD